MTIGDRTYRYSRDGFGTIRYRDLLSISKGYTETRKKVAAGSAASVLAATATVAAGTTITTGITNPDVPRALSITTGGTTANIAAGNVVITGTNVEGKTITESFTMADNLNGSVNGTKAFKTVTSVVFPAADGTSATISVGTQNVLGVNHRLVPGKTSIVVIQDGDINGSEATLQAAVSGSTIDAEEIENNTVTPATTPDGTKFLTILYWFHKIEIAPRNDDPEYSTSTSTSSTSTSSSTSSTSTSTSSTSSSTSSTSSSTSSTSTSTTTIA